MAFPQDVHDLRVEAEFAGTWTDITSYVQRRDDLVRITRGRSDEAASVERSTCRLTLNNRDGRFSPRNPTGAYYGSIGRNTPIRVSVPEGATYLLMSGAAGSGATCPDAAALGVTGDIDVRVDVTLTSWRTGQDLCGKYEATSDERSWVLLLQADGALLLAWSPDGTAGALLLRESTLPVPVPGDRRCAVRATLDVDNGAGGHTVTFYTADTLAGSWAQLGDPVVTSGATSIYDGTAGIELGDIGDSGSAAVTGKIHGFELRSGIGGAAVANPDFTIQDAGDTSFADTASSPNTWTIQVGSSLTDRDYRYHGEASAWPQRWDPSGQDVYTQVEAAGILRRLTQGASPLRSLMYRALVTLAEETPIAYWPCEDSSGATVLASGLDGGTPMTIIGSPSLASSEEFVASAPLPQLSGSTWTGNVVPHVATGEVQVRFLLAFPDSGASDGVVCRVRTTGTCPRWDLIYSSALDGGLTLKGYDDDGAELFDSGTMSPFDGKLLRASIEMTQNGADVDWAWLTTEVGSSSGIGLSGTLAGRTVGRARQAVINPDGVLTDVTVGHVSVHTSVTSILDLVEELTGYDGETAGRRLERLCQEEGITFRWAGDLDDTEAMGPQGVATLHALLTECADADGGLLYEPREVFGLGYRPRTSLYNQEAVLTLDYSAGELFGELAPTDDDLNTRNDVTAARARGSSARAELTEGALSTQAPPDGVGRYDEQVTLNLETDERLPDHAYWRLHLGTVDEERYPQVTVDLANARIAADTALSAAVRAADLGDRLVIENLPAWLPPDDVQQLIQGSSEQLGNYEYAVTFTCSPASPWNVAYADDTTYGRVDTDGSELASGVDADDTSLSVAVTAGALWTTDGGEVPFDIRVGGEVMTVTATSGASSPQAFTVTRSVNGVTKSHSAGADVRLATPAIVAL